jgi:alanyl-tRNA synthetase
LQKFQLFSSLFCFLQATHVNFKEMIAFRIIREEFKKQLPEGVIALVGIAEGKAAVTVAVTGGAGGLNAAELAKAAVIAMGGQGAGGRPDFAQGGAPDATKAAEGLAAIKALLG